MALLAPVEPQVQTVLQEVVVPQVQEVLQVLQVLQAQMALQEVVEYQELQEDLILKFNIITQVLLEEYLL
jgi:hypothetical protein